MKILIITNLFPNTIEPGRGIFNKQQFVELAKLCNLQVVAPLPWYGKKIIPQEENIDGIKTYHYRYIMIPKICRSLYGLFFYISLLPKIKKLYKEFKFDAIFSTWAYPDIFGSCLIARVLKKPIVVKVHGTDINLYTRYFLRRKMIVWALSNSDKVIAVSSALKDQMVKIGVPSEKIVVIPNGVNADLFMPMDQAECRNKLGLPLDRKIILFVGNLSKVKGVGDLITAFAGLRSIDPLLVLVGDGPLDGTLRAKAKEMAIEGNVIFAGRKAHDEIRYYMNACDVFCLPSVNEGCPNVLLEAIACGKYIVATKVGGVPEIVDSDNVGLLVKSNNHLKLAEALRSTLTIKRDHHSTSEKPYVYSWVENAVILKKELDAAIALSRPTNRSLLKKYLKSIMSHVIPKKIIMWRMACSKEVAITFDDGPNEKVTPVILEILKNKNVKATFFLIGNEIEKNRKIAEQIVKDGHSIGSHSYDHKKYDSLSCKEKKKDLNKTVQVLRTINSSSSFFRPPHGSLSFIFLLYCSFKRITTVLWSYDSMDFLENSGASLIERIKSSDIKGGDILLFHDDSGSTAQALSEIIDTLKERGLHPASLDELIKA